jgi:hypothetical protein
MKESILIALEIYLLGFGISIFIAALIKGMHAVLQHISRKKEQETKESEVSA